MFQSYYHEICYCSWKHLEQKFKEIVLIAKNILEKKEIRKNKEDEMVDKTC